MNTPPAYLSFTPPPPAATDSVLQHLLDGVRNQIEFYFSMNNLPGDPYLINLLACEPVGAVPVTLIAGFPKIQEWYQYYLAFHGTNFSNKKPWIPFYLVAEALKSSQTVHLTPDGFLVPDAWQTMEAMRQRQYASPVPTSVSSSQSMEMSPIHPPRFFHPNGDFDPQNHAGNAGMPHQHPQNQYPARPPPGDAGYYPDNNQMQYGYVPPFDSYDMAVPPHSFQPPLIGNYAGYEDNAPTAQGVVAMEYIQPDQEQYQNPPLVPEETLADPEPTSSFFSKEPPPVAKDAVSENLNTQPLNNKQNNRAGKKWKPPKNKNNFGPRGKNEKQKQEHPKENKQKKRSDSIHHTPTTKKEFEKDEELNKPDSAVLQEADFPPLQSSLATQEPLRESKATIPEKQHRIQNKKKYKKNYKAKASGQDIDKETKNQTKA